MFGTGGDIALLIGLVGRNEDCGLNILVGTRQSWAETGGESEFVGLPMLYKFTRIYRLSLLVKRPVLSGEAVVSNALGSYFECE